MSQPSIAQILRNFRIKELQHVLGELGLTKAGRKADQQQRLGQYLDALEHSSTGQREAAETLIRQTYAQMHGQNQHILSPVSKTEALDPPMTSAQMAARAASHRSAGPASSGRSPTGLVNGRMAMSRAQQNTTVRCLCGSTADRGAMIQCEGEECGIWQHCSCVGLQPPRPMPEHFFCESCTCERANPFWRNSSSERRMLLPPALLQPQQLPPSFAGMLGEEQQQSVERAFSITTHQLDLARQQGHQLQVACVMLGDPVPFRLHWPCYAEFAVNNNRMTVYRRNLNQAAGDNMRDDVMSITPQVYPGRVYISLRCRDSHRFCIMAWLAVKRSREEVEALMSPPETLPDALKRVQKLVAGDESDEISVAQTVLSLRDPLTTARIRRAARFRGVPALAAFDLDDFLDSASRTRKWQCPHTLRHSSVQDLHSDAFVQRILDSLQGAPNVHEVEVSPEGQWRLNSKQPWQSILDPLTQQGPQAAGSAAQPLQSKRQSHDLTEDGEESESFGAELRKAAHAYASVSSPATGSKRKAEVIDLASSDDDDHPQPPPPPVPRAPRSSHQSHHSQSGVSSPARAPAPPLPPFSAQGGASSDTRLQTGMLVQANGTAMLEPQHIGQPPASRPASRVAPPISASMSSVFQRVPPRGHSAPSQPAVPLQNGYHPRSGGAYGGQHPPPPPPVPQGPAGRPPGPYRPPWPDAGPPAQPHGPSSPGPGHSPRGSGWQGTSQAEPPHRRLTIKLSAPMPVPAAGAQGSHAPSRLSGSQAPASSGMANGWGPGSSQPSSLPSSGRGGWSGTANGSGPSSNGGYRGPSAQFSPPTAGPGSGTWRSSGSQSQGGPQSSHSPNQPPVPARSQQGTEHWSGGPAKHGSQLGSQSMQSQHPWLRQPEWMNQSGPMTHAPGGTQTGESTDWLGMLMDSGLPSG